MADVSIDATSLLINARNPRSVVFVSASVGYWFALDGDNSWGYYKTTDGGASWGSHVVMEASPTGVAGDVWFDQWNPGDSGTKIHTCWIDSTLHGVRYRSLDTNGDTLGTTTTIFDGASYASGVGVFCTIAKSLSGYLYCAFDIDAGAEKGLYRSTDSGATWGVLDATFVEATRDHCFLYPASGTGDGNDIWAIYQDASVNEITLKQWDSSAASAVESATTFQFAEQGVDGTEQYGWSASVRHSDGHLIAAVSGAYDNSTAEHTVFDIASTDTITTLSEIATNRDDHYYPAVFIDQATDDIYVAYNGSRSGGETIGSATKVYYTKSTDDGATWSAGDTAYMEDAAAAVAQVWAPLMGPRFYVGWRIGTTLMGGYTNSLTFSAQIAGAAAMEFGAGSSALTGVGALAGVGALSFGAGSSALGGAGALAGTAAVTLADAGTLTGSAPIAGSSALAFSNSATVVGDGQLTGAVDVTFAVSGTLDLPTGAMAGASVLEFSGSATIEGAGALVGASAMTFAAAPLLTGAGALVGTSALAFADSAALAGSGALAGAGAVTFGDAAALTGSGALAGSAALTLSEAAALAGAGALAGASALSLGDSAILAGSGALAGAPGLTFSEAALLTGDGALAGSAAIEFALSATADLPPGYLAGAAALVIGATAALSGAGALAGASATVIGGSATLTEAEAAQLAIIIASLRAFPAVGGEAMARSPVSYRWRVSTAAGKSAAVGRAPVSALIASRAAVAGRIETRPAT